ncbi:OB-fold protein [Paralcaligenes ureilyticus]|uniref:Putative nucleic acid binding protein n=1 Tax=Paralcaligenes ureilyticus TaxID=627131 RepID=A0A4R3M6A5_9BURK|nr:hypothetical protein [Paralcaligenes ureilyticus]TCT08592.1 putative nucleic acid binding protein [Paralcaligenes ureilyticus]
MIALRPTRKQIYPILRKIVRTLIGLLFLTATYIGAAASVHAQKPAPAPVAAPALTAPTSGQQPKPAIAPADTEAIALTKKIIIDDLTRWVNGDHSKLASFHKFMFHYDVSVNADQLAKAYQNSEAEGDDKYKNRILRIGGPVSRTGPNNAAPYLILGNAASAITVKAMLSRSESSKAPTLAKDGRASLICKEEGIKSGVIRLDQCLTLDTALLATKQREDKWLNDFFAIDVVPSENPGTSLVGQLYVKIEAVRKDSECHEHWTPNCSVKLEHQKFDATLAQRYRDLAAALTWK